MNDILRKGYTNVTEHVKTFKEIWTFATTVVVATGTVLGAMSLYFQTVDAAEAAQDEVIAEMTKVHEQMAVTDRRLEAELKTLSAQQLENTNLLVLKIRQDNLTDANVAIRVNDSEIFQLEQFIGINGTDSERAKRLRDLKNEAKELQITRDCIINNQHICD